MKDEPFKLVLVKDARSRVVAPGDQSLPELRRGGWQIVADDVTDPISGWTHAAIHHGALPDDFDNPMGARPMTDAIPLFRSVSVPEMADIVERGAVMGGGNVFNPHDRRPFVFFGPELTDRVIGQGEEIDRLAHYDLRFDPAWAFLKKVPEEVQSYCLEVRDRALAYLPVFNAERRKRGKSAMFTEAGHFDDFSHPNTPAFRDAQWMLPNADRIEILTRLKEFREAEDGLLEELRYVHKRRADEIRQERERTSFSSAVIQTKPIGLGLHFSQSFGRSGMGTEDEFGLFPGQVRAEDIAAVHWIKNGELMISTTMEEAVDVSDMLKGEVAGHGLPCP